VSAHTKGTIAVDFDGVVHAYTSGWTGPEPIDPPVPGARAAIAAIRSMGYGVVVFTCRALTADGMSGTKAWLAKHEIEVDEVTAVKPHAQLYLDDRAVRFDGDWYEFADDLRVCGVPRPWNADRQPAVPVQLERFPPLCATCGVVVSQVTPAGTYTACGHPIPDAGRIS
jgi:hypothetical protein